jgi:hypothetical protein
MTERRPDPRRRERALVGVLVLFTLLQLAATAWLVADVLR